MREGRLDLSAHRRGAVARCAAAPLRAPGRRAVRGTERSYRGAKRSAACAMVAILAILGMQRAAAGPAAHALPRSSLLSASSTDAAPVPNEAFAPGTDARP